LILVDSEVQLSRRQIIDGRSTSVREYAGAWKHCSVLNVAAFEASGVRADFTLCANVLSAVPSAEARERIVREIAAHTSPRGTALFVVQYRNTHFRRWEQLPHAQRTGGGWLVKNVRGASFYAPITAEELAEYVINGGMVPVDIWCCGEAALVLAIKA
jgi:hypothetical protein